MTGPSGVDAPATDAPRVITGPFQVFSALAQGDPERAARLVADLSDDGRANLVRVTRGLRRVLAEYQPEPHGAAVAAPSPSTHGPDKDPT